MKLSEAEIKKLSTSTAMEKGTREGFKWIEGEIYHAIYWNNLPKLRKISKQLADLQSRINRGTQEIKEDKEAGS